MSLRKQWVLSSLLFPPPQKPGNEAISEIETYPSTWHVYTCPSHPLVLWRHYIGANQKLYFTQLSVAIALLSFNFNLCLKVDFTQFQDCTGSYTISRLDANIILAFGSTGRETVLSYGLLTTNKPSLSAEDLKCFSTTSLGRMRARGTIHPPHQYSVPSELQGDCDKTDSDKCNGWMVFQYWTPLLKQRFHSGEHHG